MWGCSSVVERTLSMCEARGSIPRISMTVLWVSGSNHSRHTWKSHPENYLSYGSMDSAYDYSTEGCWFKSRHLKHPNRTFWEIWIGMKLHWLKCTIEVESSSRMLYYWHSEICIWKVSNLPGFEPGIFWSVVRRVIHCATSPGCKGVQANRLNKTSVYYWNRQISVVSLILKLFT